MSCIRVPLLLPVVAFASFSSIAFGWDPEDTTFDPTIESVIANGATRIGDPSPFQFIDNEGGGITGYTYTLGKKSEGSAPLVTFSLIVPMYSDDNLARGGASLFMDEAKTKEFLAALEKGIASAGTDETSLLKLTGFGPDDKWEVLQTKGEDGSPRIVLRRDFNNALNTYLFSINATKKLTGALKHALSEIQ